MKFITKILKTAVKALVILAASLGLLVGSGFAITNAVVVVSTNGRIISEEKASKLENVDCIIVLGCRVHGKEPSAMLYDRVEQGARLYNNGVSGLLFMSGDSRERYYDETGVMTTLATQFGVPRKNIETDRYGLSTYDSMVRAAKLYGFKKIVVVTQNYHLYRALYIAKCYGIEAYGVASNPREYNGQLNRDIREIAARSKDFVYCIFKPEPEMGMEK